MGGAKIYTSPESLGVSASAAPNDFLAAMANNSIFIVDSPVVTSPDWNFPNAFSTLVIIKKQLGRVYIFLYGKQTENHDYRMFLNTNNTPSGEWKQYITNADFAPLTYNDTPGDNIQDLIKAKAKIIAQNMSGNVCGMLPGGWQGEQFGFTLFGRSNNIITLMIVLQWATYTAYYNTSTDTVSSINKITMTSV